MKCSHTISMMLAGLLLVPAVAVAQGEEEASPTEPAAEEGAEASEPDAPQEEDEQPEGADRDAPRQAPPRDGEGADEGGDKTGPGGRPLREDYPGTDAAMRSRMETDRIQGVSSEEQDAGEVYDLRVKELETRIDDLKDKVFRSKSRIVLLKETLLGNRVAGSQARITYRNELGRRFELKRLTYILDGNPIRNQSNRGGELEGKDSIEVYNGAIGPGAHNLVIQLEYQGKASVFGYFGGYSFELQRACKFTVEEGIVTTVEGVAYKKGNATTSVEQRPGLRCDISKAEILIEGEAGGMASGAEGADGGGSGEPAAAEK